MLRTYETIFVTNSEVSQETSDAINTKLKGFISSGGGEIGHEEVWGVRSLSYPIKKQDKGKYTYFLYTANPELIKEMEFYLKINESVLTFMTVKVKDTADLENVPRPNAKDLL